MNEPLDLYGLERVIKQGYAKGLNRAANIVFAESQVEVPRDLGELAATGQAPSNSNTHEADEHHLEAIATYGTAYAAAQHEGYAVQERRSGEVVWVVRNYTTPGTGKHFLLNPLMRMAGGGNYERLVGETIQSELERHYRG